MNINIPFWLITLTFITFFIVLLDRLWWSKQRRGSDASAPFVIEQARSFLPILIIVLLIRSFLGQAFLVPSESLEPTIRPGDLLLVNQFHYGLYTPLWHQQLISNHTPARGDIAVVFWPVNTHYNFVKRVVGVPGDTISYIDKVLYINGKEAKQTELGTDVSPDGNKRIRLREDLLGVKHEIYVRPDRDDVNFYDLKVPKGKLFLMGDNRDESDDSRYWGFIPITEVIGKGSRVLFSWNPSTYWPRWHRIWKPI